MGKRNLPQPRIRKSSRTNHNPQPRRKPRKLDKKAKRKIPKSKAKRRTPERESICVFCNAENRIRSAMKVYVMIFLFITLVLALIVAAERLGIGFQIAHSIALAIAYFEEFFWHAIK